MRQRLTNRRLWLLVACLVATVLLLDLCTLVAAKNNALPETPTPTPFLNEVQSKESQTSLALNMSTFLQTLVEIAPVMLLAALLGGLISYRPHMTVFEHDLFYAQILLSVAGALMMLIVGNQLVRAFGLLGAASVVRYRYGLRSPRDASMLIIALGIGMATGVGLYALTVSATAIVFVVSRGLGYFTTHSNLLTVVTRPTQLRVRTTQHKQTMDRVEQVLKAHDLAFQLQRYSKSRKKRVNGLPVYTLSYTVQLCVDDNRSALTAEITDRTVTSVRWKTVKPRKR
jgi:uncharacterized membrane protein YhiD involved in acid resistance